MNGPRISARRGTKLKGSHIGQIDQIDHLQIDQTDHVDPTLPSWDAVQDLYGTDTIPKACATTGEDIADYPAPTRQHELDQYRSC